MFNKLALPHWPAFSECYKGWFREKQHWLSYFVTYWEGPGGKGNPAEAWWWTPHPLQLKVSPLTVLILSGKDAENRFSGGELSEEVYTCLPCREGCAFCTDDTPCYAQEDKYLRLAIISFQTLCMLLDFISMLVVYHFRKAKVNTPTSFTLVFLPTVGYTLLYLGRRVSHSDSHFLRQGAQLKGRMGFPKLFLWFWGKNKTNQQAKSTKWQTTTRTKAEQLVPSNETCLH